MKSPLETFSDWFEELPMEQRQDISALAASIFPGELLRGTEGQPEEFVERIRSSVRSDVEIVGVIAALAAIVDLIVRKRATPEDWAMTRQRLETMSREAEKGGVKLPSLEKVLERMPLTGRQWQRTAASWNTLRAGELSGEELDKWWDESLLAAVSHRRKKEPPGGEPDGSGNE